MAATSRADGVPDMHSRRSGTPVAARSAAAEATDGFSVTNVHAPVGRAGWPPAAGEFARRQGHRGAGGQVPAVRVNADGDEAAGEVIAVHADRGPRLAGTLG